MENLLCGYTIKSYNIKNKWAIARSANMVSIQEYKIKTKKKVADTHKTTLVKFDYWWIIIYVA